MVDEDNVEKFSGFELVDYQVGHLVKRFRLRRTPTGFLETNKTMVDRNLLPADTYSVHRSSRLPFNGWYPRFLNLELTYPLDRELFSVPLKAKDLLDNNRTIDMTDRLRNQSIVVEIGEFRLPWAAVNLIYAERPDSNAPHHQFLLGEGFTLRVRIERLDEPGRFEMEIPTPEYSPDVHQ